MTTPARELRDALAEALFRADVESGRNIRWANLAADVRAYWVDFADRLIAVLPLPSVKLKMGWEE